MKTTLRLSILINLGLLGGLIFTFADLQREKIRAIASPSTEDKSIAPSIAARKSMGPRQLTFKAFRWSQLESTNDYEVYVNNLRAIGCPEPTVEDIVWGDVERAFSYERNQLGLDASGDGPWSRQEELRMEARLLGQSPVAVKSLATRQSPMNRQAPGGNEVARNDSQSSFSTDPEISYPPSYQNGSRNLTGLSVRQNTTVGQPDRQLQNNTGGQNPAIQPMTGAPSDDGRSNPNSENAASLPQTQAQEPDPLLISMGAHDYMIYEQQLYNAWFQSQIEAATAAGEPLTINPDDFSK